MSILWIAFASFILGSIVALLLDSARFMWRGYRWKKRLSRGASGSKLSPNVRRFDQSYRPGREL